MIPFHAEFDLTKKCGKYNTHSSLRSPDILPLEYRCLELLHRRIMSHFSLGFIPFQTLVIQLSLFCNWMLLAHWDGLGFSRYIMLIGGFTLVSFWAVVLQTCGKFYAKNKESWRLVEDKYFRKWRKSVTPLYFGHPGYYVIKRLSILKFCKTIIRGTFRMMVTLKNV